MEREKLNKFLVSKKLKKRMKAIFLRSVNIGEFEDFFSDYKLYILEGYGKHQTLDQFRIDWIRKQLGKDKSRSPVKVEFNESTVSVEQYHQYDYNKMIRFFTGHKRALLILYSKYGLTLNEIGDVFGVGEARISQILNDIRRTFCEDQI